MKNPPKESPTTLNAAVIDLQQGEFQVKQPVARTLKIFIENEDYRGNKSVVKPTNIPDKVIQTKDMVTELYPDTEIVYLGRDTFKGARSQWSKGTYSLFFQTLQWCFNLHLPIAFRPEVLWYLIIHEISQAVKLNPERYRLYFSNQEKKQTIEIVDQGTSIPNFWPPYLEKFTAMLKEKVPSAIGDLMMPTFSTSTIETHAATAVAFMDAASPFYDYRMRLCCGLPLIRLDGNPEDYAKIVSGAEALSHLFGKDLHLYFEHLLPVLRTIADQAAGAPLDNQFWSSLYNHESGSGGSDGSDDLGGWITTFVNYIRKVEGEYFGPNITAKLTPKPAEMYDWTKKNRWMTIGMVPNHVSSADFLLTIDGVMENQPMKFIGGMLGADEIDGFVTPQLSYGVLKC